MQKLIGLLIFVTIILILMALAAWCEDNWTVTKDGDIELYIKEGKHVHFKDRGKI